MTIASGLRLLRTVAKEEVKFVRLLVLIVCLGFPGLLQAEQVAEPDATRVVLDLEVVGSEAGFESHLVGHLSWVVGGAGESDSASVPLDADLPGTVELDLEPGSAWKLTGEAPGVYVPETVISVPRDSEALLSPGGPATLGVELFRAGVLSGAAEFPRSEALPSEMRLTFSPAPRSNRGAGRLPSASAPPAGESVCRLADEGEFRCELPLGVFDLKLHPRGFASIFLWDVRIESESLRTLGTLAFRPGASLVGAVDVTDGPARMEDLWAELQPLGIDAPPGVRQRLKKKILTSPVGQRGEFQFTDLEAGMYRVVVGGKGMATVARAPVEVVIGLETDILTPIPLGRPVDLEIVVDPGRTPSGDPWIVSLAPLRKGVARSPDLSGKVDPSGGWKRSGLNPGWYQVEIADPYHQRWWIDQMEVTSTTPTTFIDLPLVRIEGNVTRGREPVRARLKFSDLIGNQEISVYSSPEGEFQGVLPSVGTWNLQALLRPGDDWAGLGRVEVVKPARGEAAILEVELPDTWVRGAVVDERGSLVDEVLVMALEVGKDRDAQRAEDSESKRDPDSAWGKAQTDSRGRFQLEALPEGIYEFRAFEHRRVDGGVSRPREVEVRDGKPVEGLRLVLEDPKRFSGTVVSSRGPVLGARIFAWPEGGVGTMPDSPAMERTDIRGRFEVSIPRHSTSLRVLVLAWGYTAKITRVLVTPEAPSPTFLLDDFGGDVEVKLDPKDSELWGELGLAAGELVYEGVEITLVAFREWASILRSPTGEAEGWIIPNLPVGSMRLCDLPLEGGRCREVTVFPGSSVSVPAPIGG